MLQTVVKALTLTIIVYSLTLTLSRLLDRKLISQMTFFDFVVGVILGSAAVSASTAEEKTSISGFVILITVSALTLIIDFTHIKSIRMRKAVESEPVTVVENGNIVTGNMKKLRLSPEELMMLLREKNVFNVADVEFAILEVDGKLSVLPKSQKQPLTPSDLNIPTAYKGLTRDLIIDGNIMEHNLSYINLGSQWLMDQLKGYGIQNIKDVYYAGLDTSGNLYISRKQASGETPGKHGIE